MAFDQHVNFGYSTVAAGSGVISSTSGTSLIIAAAGDLPDPASGGAYNVTVWPASAQPSAGTAEIMRVTAKTTTTLTVTRAQEGTTALSGIAAGFQVSATMTKKLLTDIETAIPAGGGGGSGAFGAFSGASVTHSAAQSMASGTVTALNFDTEDWDTDAYHDTVTNNTRFTLPSAGKYLITGWIPWAPQNTTSRRNLEVLKNGTAIEMRSEMMGAGSGAGEPNNTVSVVVDGVAGDYYELVAWQNSGSALSSSHVSGTDLRVRFQITKIGGVIDSGAELNYTAATSTVTVTGSSAATATAVVSPPAVTFDGAPVLVQFFCPQVQVTAPQNIQVVLMEGATELYHFFTQSLGGGAIALSGWVRFSPTAGPHTYAVKAFNSGGGGNPTLTAGAGGAGAQSPMFVRFTKV